MKTLAALTALALLLAATPAQAGTGLTVREAKKATMKEAQKIYKERGGFAVGLEGYQVGRCSRRTRTKIMCRAEFTKGSERELVCFQKVLVVKRSGRVRASRSGAFVCP
jgi:hypothetical protein